MQYSESPKRRYGFVGEEKETPAFEKQALPTKTKTLPQNEEFEDGDDRPSAFYHIFHALWWCISGVFILCWRIIVFIWKVFAQLLLMIFGIKTRSQKERQRVLLGLAGKSILIAGGIGIVFLVGLTLWISKDLPDPNKITDRTIAQSTKIYDRTGEHLLYEVFADEKRTLVSIDDIPQNLIDGVIATEDTAFYEHNGVRPLSILRAFVYGLLPGKKVAGTSTLTQQLVKNAILTNERSYIRKLKEIILSLRLEQKYDKDQILQIYFNEIPYGSTNYGVEAAALNYFGKHVKDLDLQESATLAGMPKAPTSYLNNPDALLARRNFVLRRMFEENYITEPEKDDAQKQPLTLSRHFGDMKAPHFVLYVKEQLVEKFGEQVVDTGGLKVITTLDWKMQESAQKIFDEQGTEILKTAEANNLSLLALNPQNGQIVTMIGSKDFNDESIQGQFNVATLGKRQPGSSFKPIIYAAAFEKGYTPDTILYDVVTDFDASKTKPYIPQNYDLGERGPVTLRQALQGSLNIPAVKTLYLVGETKGIDFAKKLGYTTLSQGGFGLSLVLGGGEVKLLEHVSAYGVFANNGVLQQPTSILKVEDPNGDVLYEWKRTRGTEVLSKEVSATITNVLSDDASRAYVFGAGGILTLKDRPVAGKTGTTNNYVDAWTVGYTPSLVAGVWAGNTNNTPMKKGDGGSRVAAPIWNAFMTAALENAPVETFPEPPANDATKPVLRGSTGGSVVLKINRITNRLATSSTPEGAIEERTYIQPHDILHYVQKDDPRGPAPTNPADDPQYNIWETAIQDWITRKQTTDPEWNIYFSEAPTELDTDFNPELAPALTIEYPAPSTTVYQRDMVLRIQASAPRGITKAIYQIDGNQIGVVRGFPFSLSYYALDLKSGQHSLIVSVEDDMGNRTTQESIFILEAGEDAPMAIFSNTESILKISEAPWVIYLKGYRLDEITKIDIFGIHNNNTTLLGTIDDLKTLVGGRLPFRWNSAESGEWQIYSSATNKNGNLSTSPQINLIIE